MHRQGLSLKTVKLLDVGNEWAGAEAPVDYRLRCDGERGRSVVICDLADLIELLLPHEEAAVIDDLEKVLPVAQLFQADRLERGALDVFAMLEDLLNATDQRQTSTLRCLATTDRVLVDVRPVAL